METIKIHGKEYAPVSERIKEFRDLEAFKGYQLISEIIKFNDGKMIEQRSINVDKKGERHETYKSVPIGAYVLIKASIIDPNGNIVATGMAYEEKSSSRINNTSHIENCETSAWGRALANLGIGTDGSIASADEVANAIKNQ